MRRRVKKLRFGGCESCLVIQPRRSRTGGCENRLLPFAEARAVLGRREALRAMARRLMHLADVCLAWLLARKGAVIRGPLT